MKLFRKITALLLSLVMVLLTVPSNPVGAEDGSELHPGEVVAVDFQLQPPDKTEYFWGEPLDTTGMVATVLYSDGTSEILEYPAMDGYDPYVLGPQEVFVSYGDWIVSFFVSVSMPGGSCGGELSWDLGEDGCLTISGIGAMTDFDYENPAPWLEYSESITRVVIGDGVTSVGACAFQECMNLQTVQLGSNVATIGEYAFHMCTSLESINLPEGLVSIGLEAFGWCDMLQSLSFPESLQSLGYAAIHHCSMLESIYIPRTLTDIGRDNFAYCGGLTSIRVSSENPYYSSDDSGVLFDKNKTELILAPDGIAGSYTIPSGVTAIGDYAFEGCFNLESVTIPEGVSVIGASAFYECMSLQSVTMAASVTEIGQSAFGNCGMLMDVYYGGSESRWAQISIGEENESLSKIATIHFTQEEVELTGITVTPPNKTQYYVGYVLDLTGMVVTAQYSDGHTEVITEGYAVTGYDAYYVKTHTITVSYKGYTDTFQVTVKDKEPTHIIVTPPTMTECWVGEALDLTGMVVTAYYADGSTRKILSGYDLTGFDTNTPGTQTITIGFKGKTDTFTVTVKAIVVTSITVTAPEKTQYWVGEELDTTGMVVTAFYSDGSGLVIHEGYTIAGYDANTPGEQTVTVTYEEFSATFTVTVAEPPVVIVAEGTCGENLTWKLTDDGTLTISGTGDMDEISTPEQQPWYDYRESVLKVVVEEGVTGISRYAFYSNQNLAQVEFADSIRRIGTSVLDGTAFYYDEANWGYGYSPLYVGKHLIQVSKTVSGGGYAVSGTVTVEEGTLTIADQAFASCIYVEGVVIPASVISIGYSSVPNVFSACKSLTGVWIDSNNPYYSSDSYGVVFNKDFSALLYAPRTMSGTYTVPDSVTSIGECAFSYCELSGLNMGGSVTSIGGGAFEHTNLYEVTIPDSVQTIGGSIFYQCRSLHTVTLGSGITQIPDYAFYGCSTLATVNLNDGVTNIGCQAFANCSSLTGIVLPYGVTTIAHSAFTSCYNLQQITLPGTLQSVDIGVFYECDELADVYYYGTASQWQQISVGFGNDFLLNATIHHLPGQGGSTSGTCGENAVWDVDIVGVLTISGSGSVDISASGSSAPWYGFADIIQEVVIEEGVTDLGDYSFAQCNNLLRVTIPETVTAIGEDAFSGCEALTDVYYAGSQEQWESISVGGNNSCLTAATIHFAVQEEPVLIGDVNGDGEVNNRDRAILTRYLADWDGYEEIDLVAADVNQDGEVNNRDRAILTRYLADWEGYEELPLC